MSDVYNFMVLVPPGLLTLWGLRKVIKTVNRR
jgi:hypothetical protein